MEAREGVVATSYSHHVRASSAHLGTPSVMPFGTRGCNNVTESTPEPK
jgi:hypothetical protein